MPDPIHHGSAAAKALYAPVARAKAAYLEALRALPPEPVGAFTFHTPDGNPITLAELFGEKHDLILIHNMGRRCNYCTLWADGLVGHAAHLQRRVALALVSADEPGALRAAIAERGWNFPCVSGRGSGLNAAMRFGTDEKPLPGCSTFHRDTDGSIRRIAAAAFGPGDDFCLVWPMFDLLESGPNGWEPK